MGHKSERIYVTDVLEAYVDFNDMKLDNLAGEAARLKAMVVEAGGVEDSAFIHYESYGYDNAFEIRVKYRRLESDKEYEERVAKEAKSREKELAKKKKMDEDELNEYYRLREKFGDIK